MISASLKLKTLAEASSDEIQSFVNACEKQDGFIKHRVLEPSQLRKSPILLTYWKSAKAYRKAIQN